MQNKPYFFFWKQGFPKGGRGGGPTLGKNSQKISLFFLGSVPKLNWMRWMNSFRLSSLSRLFGLGVSTGCFISNCLSEHVLHFHSTRWRFSVWSTKADFPILTILKPCCLNLFSLVSRSNCSTMLPLLRFTDAKWEEPQQQWGSDWPTRNYCSGSS